MFNLKIANKVFTILNIYTSTFDYCVQYITDESSDFTVPITQEDIELERVKSIRDEQMEGVLHHEYSVECLETTAVQRKITDFLFDCDVLLFHGSAVAVDGLGYLFTAKSGTGKSTHTKFWREMFGKRAVMVNDDKPFLQMSDKGVVVYGSPWNGKHRLGSNISVPLKAMCILERSTENWIKPISSSEALQILFQQSQRPRNSVNMIKYMELIDKLACRVEFYRMGCNMNPEAALMAYEVMSQERKGTKL